MANTTVFTGADGAITLSVPQGREGEAAQAAIDAYALVSVGRATDVRVEVHADVRAFNEIGQRYPTELRPGNVRISGTIGRAYVNGALLQLMLGEAASSRPAASWTHPAFNVTVLLENAARPGTRSTLTLHDVKIDNWVVEVPEDEFVMESVGFQALYMSVADE
jgi:hypothetical protein